MNNSFRSFSFDRDYAKANGAVKTAQLILSCIVYIAVVVIISFLSISFLKSGFSRNNVDLIRISLIICASAVLHIYGFLIEPFKEASITRFTVDDNGKITRFVRKKAGAQITVLNEMQVIKLRRDSWTVSYIDDKGKKKALVVPKAYPGLEEYMKTIN